MRQEVLEQAEAAEKINAELRKRPLSISYKITLAPVGGNHLTNPIIIQQRFM